MKEWMTAREIAELRLEGLPRSKRGVNLLADRAGWSLVDQEARRPRRCGGWEYHISLLPEPARADWERRRERALADLTPPPAVHPAAEPATQLSARRRQVMEARAQVLVELRRRIAVDGISQRQAILGLIAEFRGDQQLPEGQRSLPAPLFDACTLANDRRTTLGKSQIYAWIKAEAEGGVPALAPKATRPKAADHAFAFLPDLLRAYCRPQKPDLTEAHALLVRQMGDAAPSYSQCRRALASLSGTSRHLDAHRGREGRLALKARLAFKRRSTDGLQPTDIYIADGKTFDAEIAHPIHGRPFRPEITSILDVRTRKCVGWSVALSEAADAVADAVRMAVEKYGIMAMFYADRGPGYRNDRMDGPVYGLCARLGTTPTHSLPYNSQARGIIERFNRTCWNPHAQTYDSFIGAGMDREAKQLFHKASRSEIRAFGSSRLLVGWDEFVRRAEGAVEAYNAASHDALRRRDPISGRWIERSPNDAWADAVSDGFAPFTIDAGEADDLFRPCVPRMVARGEIQLFTNRYFHADLVPWHGERVMAGYDMHDATRIWVRAVSEVDGELRPGALICVADWGGNETHYMPRSQTEAARDRRAAGRQSRLAVKQEEVELERRAPLFVEHEAPGPVIEVTPEPDAARETLVEPEAPPEPRKVVPIDPLRARYN